MVQSDDGRPQIRDLPKNKVPIAENELSAMTRQCRVQVTSTFISNKLTSLDSSGDRAPQS